MYEINFKTGILAGIITTNGPYTVAIIWIVRRIRLLDILKKKLRNIQDVPSELRVILRYPLEFVPLHNQCREDMGLEDRFRCTDFAYIYRGRW